MAELCGLLPSAFTLNNQTELLCTLCATYEMHQVPLLRY